MPTCEVFAKAAVQEAQAEVDRLYREYKAAHERLALRLDTLKKKVELLNDSGCPDGLQSLPAGGHSLRWPASLW